MRPEQTLRSRTIGYLALGLTILASSTYNSFGKQLTGAVSPLSLLFLSEFLTAFFVMLSFGVLPTLKRMFQLRHRYLMPLMVLGLMNGVLAPLLYFTGLHESTAINAELFGRTEMIALPLLAILILREEHLTRAHVIAGSVILFGLAFVALKGFTEDFSLRGGDLLFILSGITYAGGSIVFKKYLRHVAPELVIVSRASVAVIVFLLFLPLTEHPLVEELHAFPPGLIPALIGFGFISRFLNLFGFYEAIERVPVTQVSLFSTLNIIGGITFALLYLGEPILWYHLIGGSFIVLGALLLELLGVHPTEEELERHLKQHHRHHL